MNKMLKKTLILGIFFFTNAFAAQNNITTSNNTNTIKKEKIKTSISFTPVQEKKLLDTYYRKSNTLEQKIINKILNKLSKTIECKEGFTLIQENKLDKAISYFEELYDKEIHYFNIENLHLLLIILHVKNNNTIQSKELIHSYFKIFSSVKTQEYQSYIDFLNFHTQFDTKKDIRYGANNINQIISLGQNCIYNNLQHKETISIIKDGVELLEEFKVYQVLYNADLYLRKRNVLSAILLYKNIIMEFQNTNKKFNDPLLQVVYRLYTIFHQMKINNSFCTKILNKHKNSKWFTLYKKYTLPI